MTSRDSTHSIADALPNGHLIGSFELRGAVSRSDAGIVYRAWDHGLAIDVAIKEHLPTAVARRLDNGDVIREPLNAGAAYESSLEGFISGTRALAKCDHAALVRVLHLQNAHGTAYRVMPWNAGERLRERRHSMSRPPDESALRALLDDLLGALEAIHRSGTVHGGVHPAQILMLPGERALLLGPCAVSADAGGAPGPWTDLRAVADVARFCISGVPPTADGQQVEPMAEILERLVLDAGLLHYGREFMRVLDAAASPDVALRPRSVAEFREQLRHAARVDAVPKVADGQLQADAPQSDTANLASDAEVALLIERVFESIPPRTPARPWSPRANSPAAPIGVPQRPAAEPSIDRSDQAPRHMAAAKRHRIGVGAGAIAVLLALGGYGAWQLRDWTAPLVLAPSVSAAGVPAALPVPAAVLAEPSRDIAPPIGESAARPATNVVAPTHTMPDVEPKHAPVERAEAPPAPAQSPREVCGDRRLFSLYYCMQRQCERNAWINHPQCVQFRATDQVG